MLGKKLAVDAQTGGQVWCCTIHAGGWKKYYIGIAFIVYVATTIISRRSLHKSLCTRDSYTFVRG